MITFKHPLWIYCLIYWKIIIGVAEREAVLLRTVGNFLYTLPKKLGEHFFEFAIYSILQSTEGCFYCSLLPSRQHFKHVASNKILMNIVNSY